MQHSGFWQRIKGHNLINYSTDKLFEQLNSNSPKVMEHKLNTFKADLYNVFVQGNANSAEMKRVFIILAIPVSVMVLIGFHSIKY
jgi:hypothetical protein